MCKQNIYQVEVHDPHDPNDERKIDDSDDHDEQNKEVDAAFPPAIDTNLVNNSCRVLVIPVDLVCRLCWHFDQLPPS